MAVGAGMRAALKDRKSRFCAALNHALGEAYQDGQWNKTKGQYGGSAVALYTSALAEIQELERHILRARAKFVSQRTLTEIEKRRGHWSDADLEQLEIMMELEADKMGLLVPGATRADSGTSAAPTSHGERK